jgi:hypothetical protein
MLILPVKNKPDTIHVTQSITGDTITVYGHVTGPNYLHITREQARDYWPILKAWGEGCPLRQLMGRKLKKLQDFSVGSHETKRASSLKRSRAKKVY